jgi:tripartite-type tricarboxylate transporter receptor subunit TctC
VLAAAPLRAADEQASAFVQGKQVRFYTMGGPGGGYDTYMRALVLHLERKLGARMLPTNEPGAGGLIAINRTLNAPPDGLTILLVGGETLVTAQLYEAPGVNYDVRKLAWLARVSSEAKVALLGPKSPYGSVLEMVRSDTPVTWAGSSKIDGNADFTAIMAHALGMKSKIITGYKGTGDMNLAIQRGEVDGRVVSEESAALYGASNGMRAVAVLARRRVEQFPEAPTLFEVAGAWRSAGAPGRLACQHCGAGPVDAGYAGHTAGARRPAAEDLGGNHPRSRLRRRGQKAQPLSKPRRGG